MGSGENRVTIELNTKRLCGQTVFGAVGRCLKKPVFMLAKSTNIEEVKKFWLVLKKSLKNNYSRAKIPVVLDNHPAHRSKKSMEIMNEYFIPLF